MLKRSMMIMYSGARDIYSHQVRIVLAEKGVNVDIVNVDDNHPSEELAEINPYNTLPTLVDRDLVLYNAPVILEYLDERFPHPPLLPVYPVARAKSRLMMHRIERDWYALAHKIERGTPGEQEHARKDLTEGITALVPVFNESPYFLSDDFSLVDCCLMPLLWRLPALGIKLPKQAKPIFTYEQHVFHRNSFQVSLTEDERELRE
ncbi:MAG TPA: stringent starvation protein SspA [Coxiellaceae bacterium]|nr:stringent starvation protein SspA [Coxiellaceae bacterium]